MITTPARAFELRKSKYDWGYKATMINRPDYERVEKPHTRGKTLGGCSALNYYTWVRGSHGTYDDWEEYGGPGWNWNGCEQYFDKVRGLADKNLLGSLVLMPGNSPRIIMTTVNFIIRASPKLDERGPWMWRFPTWCLSWKLFATRS